MPGQDQTGVPDEGPPPCGHGRLEDDARRVRVHLLDPLHVCEETDGRRSGRRVDDEFPREHDVVGAEGFAVVPGDVALELPRHRGAVAGDASVLQGGDLRSEDRDQVALGINCRERLIEEACRVQVLLPGGEVRVEQRRTLPPQQAQESASPAALRRERLHIGARALRRGSTGQGEHLCCHRDGDAELGHRRRESASRQHTVLHVVDQDPRDLFVWAENAHRDLLQGLSACGTRRSYAGRPSRSARGIPGRFRGWRPM